MNNSRLSRIQTEVKMKQSIQRFVCCLFVGLCMVVSIHCTHPPEGDVDVMRVIEEYSSGKYKYLVKQRHQCRTKGLDIDDPKSTAGQMDMFASPSKTTSQSEMCAYVGIVAAKKLRDITKLSPCEYFKRYPHAKKRWQKYCRKYCEPRKTRIRCNHDYKYRTPDGSCNNLKHERWGMSERAQHRFLKPAYDDGCNSPRQTGAFGLPLPSTRTVSNFIHRSKYTILDSHLNVLHMSYGQFLDHDMVFTPVIKGEGGADIKCCGIKEYRPECIPIPVPFNDPFYKDRCLNLVRSSPAPSRDCLPRCREQINEVTSYVDASHVYGSTKERMDSLRTFKNGKLKTKNNNALPGGGKSKCILETPQDYCQKAGDKRSNVVPNLGSLHFLFVREHNRLCDALKVLNPHWNDETLFQEAKKIVSAILQHITYNEYLPPVLGRKHMYYYKLFSRSRGHDYVYSEKADATQRNCFGVAAFRFGHSQITNDQKEFRKDSSLIESRKIEDTFHRPHMCVRKGGFGCEGVIHWELFDHAAKSDGFFESGIRNNLFKDADGKSLDLVSVNIQRGRDHGIPPYWKWRKWCGLNYRYLTDHKRTTKRRLLYVYRNIKNIDLFSGAISEQPVNGGIIGPTFACIVARQFQLLKKGDRFWYENKDRRTGFTREQLDKIKQMTMSHIICNNIDRDEIARNAFNVPSASNPYVNCKNLKPLNLYPWKDW